VGGGRLVMLARQSAAAAQAFLLAETSGDAVRTLSGGWTRWCWALPEGLRRGKLNRLADRGVLGRRAGTVTWKA
jgi:hypothetical protein